MDAGGLRLLKVLHRASGVCVFSRRWKWHPHAHEEGVDALVLSFTQFAREIDGGNVVQVHFDSGAGGGVDDKRNADRRPSSGPLQFSTPQGGLTMSAVQDERVQLVLFHDRTTEDAAAKLKAVLYQLLMRFSELFASDLTTLSSELPPNVVLSPEQRTMIEARFLRFVDEVQSVLEGSLAYDETSKQV